MDWSFQGFFQSGPIVFTEDRRRPPGEPKAAIGAQHGAPTVGRPRLTRASALDERRHRGQHLVLVQERLCRADEHAALWFESQQLSDERRVTSLDAGDLSRGLKDRLVFDETSRPEIRRYTSVLEIMCSLKEPSCSREGVAKVDNRRIHGLLV